MLWLCLHLPELPLEIHTRGGRCHVPQAVRTADKDPRLEICNAAARHTGLRSGMKVSAACALVNDLELYERNPRRQRAALEGLAAWAGQFTSQVSLEPERDLLLEIGGSLTLFAGVGALLRKVRDGVSALGYLNVLAAAPTPRAALWLARCGREQVLTDTAAVQQALQELPVAIMALESRTRAALQRIGVQTLGECLRLPRAGMNKRFGCGLREALDRALGRRADPRSNFVAPTCFRRRLTLPVELDNHEALAFAFHRLFIELGGALRARASGIRQLTYVLFHESAPPTSGRLSLLRPGNDPRHLLELLRTQLEKRSLCAPVCAVALATQGFEPLDTRNTDLFSRHAQTADSHGALLERLRNRLGSDAVHRISVHADYRPERAWRVGPSPTPSPAALSRLRPVWLFAQPLALESVDGQPLFDGVLRRESGRERIESGWWDGHDIARDYYIARNPHGERVWIFRELEGARHWYAHGVFG